MAFSQAAVSEGIETKMESKATVYTIIQTYNHFVYKDNKHTEKKHHWLVSTYICHKATKAEQIIYFKHLEASDMMEQV